MAMVLDAFMGKFSELLSNYVKEEVIAVLGVKGDLQKLQLQMASIRCLLEDAEKQKFAYSSVDNWLSQLKDVLYDADVIIDLCRVEGAQLLADQTRKSKTSKVRPYFFSSAISCCMSVPFRHEIGNRIKDLNARLGQIYENRRMFKFEHSTNQDGKITQVNTRQTSSIPHGVVGGKEVDLATNEILQSLLTEEAHKKCRLLAVTGMGGIGKTTLAKIIINHPKIETSYELKIWICVSQTYSETELLQEVIRRAQGHYGDAKSKEELLLLLVDAVVSAGSLFLVLDDVWRADVWAELLEGPLHKTNASIRVLVTTRNDDVAREMKVAQIYPVRTLSVESSWDMLRMRLFSEEEEEQMNNLKQLGLQIVERCGGLPLAIRAIAGVLETKGRTRKEWTKVLRNDAWSTTALPEELRGALYLSFEDLPSHLKQCFLYCSLQPEDAYLDRREISKLWVAEGFVIEPKVLLMEDKAEEYFNELVSRNLLIGDPYDHVGRSSKMHDLYRSLALFLSKNEIYCGQANAKDSVTLAKLRRMSVVGEQTATEILDSVSDQGALRTLLASDSDVLLDDERLSRLPQLRVLQIERTLIHLLPKSIGNLVHLRYLDLNWTSIIAIPESIGRLANLQFLNICNCEQLKQLPSGITRLCSLRNLGLDGTPLDFIPKGIGKLQQLNYLSGFVVSDNDSCSKLEELSSLKQIRTLKILRLERAQSGKMLLRELSQLSNLKLYFKKLFVKRTEEQNDLEELFDELIPPQSLEVLKIYHFIGRRLPTWMALSSFENYTPFLTKLTLRNIESCTELPPLGQLLELRQLSIHNACSVKKIGEEFLGGGVNVKVRTAFPMLELLKISCLLELEDWSFGVEVDQNGTTKLKVMPRLQTLEIRRCPLLKQLPQGLKYTAMKKASIIALDSLKVVECLPTQTESLVIMENDNLLKVCCLPALRNFHVGDCNALSCVESLDALQVLKFWHIFLEDIFPDWLLKLLQRREMQSPTTDDFLLELKCCDTVLEACMKGGSYWDVIQHIPRVVLYEKNSSRCYLRYSKMPYVYDTDF